MHILFIFLDGIGLGEDDPTVNPFAIANTPTLCKLAGGQRWLRSTGLRQSERAAFIPTDACLNVDGRPQSGTGQAAILTGRNIPDMTGRHYGPKPDARTRELLDEDNFFIRVRKNGKRAALLDAYPDRLIRSISRGKTLPSSIQYAAVAAGQALFQLDDLIAQRALTTEWTGQPWRDQLKIMETPVHTPFEAGQMLVQLSRDYDFAFHSHWMTDYIGHRGPLQQAVELLETFDQVMAGVLSLWRDDEGLVIISSDHGNMEVIGDRRHTENEVPSVVIGAEKQRFVNGLQRLTDFVPLMSELLFQDSN